jgi:polysaccharide pyruvyl transferase WcaK-like protein
MKDAQGRPVRLGFFGLLGSGNLGNDGSLDAMIGYLRECHPETKLDFLVTGPERVAGRYGAAATHLRWSRAHGNQLSAVPQPVLKVVGGLLDPVRTLRWVRRQDAVIIPGMGVLEGTTPIKPWGFPFGLFTLALSGRLTRTDVLLVSVGADVVGSRSIRWMIKRTAGWARYRSYRDRTSRDAMRAMGVDVSADAITPDLAFRHVWRFREPDGTRTVGLGLMNYHGNNDERAIAADLHRTYVAQMTLFARWLVDQGRPIRFFTCDRVDRPVIDQVVENLRSYRPHLDASMLIDTPANDLSDLRRQMAGVDTVVASRYHNVLTAIQMAIPTVAVGYSSKHDELMQSAGLGAFHQEARSVDAARLIAQHIALESDPAPLVAAMREHNRVKTEGVEQHFAALSAVIFGGATRRAAVGDASSSPA